MTRGFKLFVVIYAAAMVVITAASIRFEIRAGHGWFDSLIGSALVGVTTCYLLLAINYLFSRKRDRAVGALWLGIVFLLAPFVLALTLLALGSETVAATDAERFLLLAVVGVGIILAVIYVAVTGALLKRLGPGEDRPLNRRGRVLLPPSLLLGAALVLSSLFLEVTEGASGWGMLSGERHWVTHYYSVGKGAIFGGPIPWLQPVFGPVGYVFYIVGLLASLALVSLLVKSSFSAEKMRASVLLAPLTGVVGLVCLWLLTDIFWGWNNDLSFIPWTATLAFGCWLAVLIFGAVLLVPVARGDAAGWRLRALLILQAPIAAFNLVMLPVYFVGDYIYFPGLGLLIVGLLLENWTCMDLVAYQGRESAPA